MQRLLLAGSGDQLLCYNSGPLSGMFLLVLTSFSVLVMTKRHMLGCATDPSCCDICRLSCGTWGSVTHFDRGSSVYCGCHACWSSLWCSYTCSLGISLLLWYSSTSFVTVLTEARHFSCCTHCCATQRSHTLFLSKDLELLDLYLMHVGSTKYWTRGHTLSKQAL